MSAPLLCDAQTLADGVSSPKPGPLSPSQVVLWQRTSLFPPSLEHMFMAVELRTQRSTS